MATKILNLTLLIAAIVGAVNAVREGAT